MLNIGIVFTPGKFKINLEKTWKTPGILVNLRSTDPECRSLEITSGDMPMLSDLQLVYMGPRNSTQLLKINTTKFQVEREPVYM